MHLMQKQAKVDYEVFKSSWLYYQVEKENNCRDVNFLFLLIMEPRWLRHFVVYTRFFLSIVFQNVYLPHICLWKE